MSSADVIALQDTVPLIKPDPSIVEYILDLVEATRHDDQLHLGVSPRGASGADPGGAGVGGVAGAKLHHAR